MQVKHDFGPSDWVENAELEQIEEALADARTRKVILYKSRDDFLAAQKAEADKLRKRKRKRKQQKKARAKQRKP